MSSLNIVKEVNVKEEDILTLERLDYELNGLQHLITEIIIGGEYVEKPNISKDKYDELIQNYMETYVKHSMAFRHLIKQNNLDFFDETKKYLIDFEALKIVVTDVNSDGGCNTCNK